MGICDTMSGMERTDRLTTLVAAGALAGSISIGTCSTNREIDRPAGAVETLRTDVRADIADVRASVRRPHLRAVEIEIAGTASPPGD